MDKKIYQINREIIISEKFKIKEKIAFSNENQFYIKVYNNLDMLKCLVYHKIMMV